jgi:TfoX/Sxy family transcriptional regulator of competence genes
MKPVNSYVQFVVDQLQDAGNVSCRAMFGGYALYCDLKVVALICDNRLYVKPTVKGREMVGNITEALPYPNASPHFLIEHQIEDKDWICELIRKTADELPAPKNKNSSKKKILKKQFDKN